MSEEACCEMPRYKCHKEVWALKIKSMVFTTRDDGAVNGAVIQPEDEGYGSFPVDLNYLKKHQPVDGGYYVVYTDGYKSFSPAKAFEDGYTKV